MKFPNYFSMFSSKQTVGINVNDRSIEMAVVQVHEHPIRIHGVARVALPAGTIVRGVIINEQSMIRALRACRSLCRLPDHAHIHASVSLSELLVFPFSVTQPTTDDQGALHRAVYAAADEQVPLAEKERIVLLIPPGTHGIFMGYAMNSNILAHYRKVFSTAGFEMEYFEPESMALCRYSLPDVHKAQTTHFVDIGTNITHVITVHNGYPILSQSVSVGAEITQKKIHAALRHSLHAFGIQHVTEAIEKQAIREALISLIDELKALLLRSDRFCADTGIVQNAREILMVGGGSLLPHVMDMLQESIVRPVHQAQSGHVIDTKVILPRELPIYMHALGSVLRFIAETSGNMLTEVGASGDKPLSAKYSMVRFKNRTTFLITVFVLLVIIAIVLSIVRFNEPKKLLRTNIIAPTPLVNTSTPQDDGAILDAFSVKFRIGTGFALSRVDVKRERQTSVQATGTREEQSRAQGELTLKNTTTENKTLVSGTRLQAESGAIFRTQQDLTIPASGSLKAIVLADEAGLIGNVSAGKFTIPGLSTSNQEKIYAQSDAAFTGGTAQVQVVAKTDITTAVDALKQALLQEIDQAFRDQKKDTEIILPFPSETHFVAQADPEEGSRTPATTIKVTAQGVGVRIDAEQIKSAITDRLGKNITIDKQSLEITSFLQDTQEGVLKFSVIWHR